MKYVIGILGGFLIGIAVSYALVDKNPIVHMEDLDYGISLNQEGIIVVDDYGQTFRLDSIEHIGQLLINQNI
jgi:hypothetical protein